MHLLVINDASAVKDEEWTLLIRLIRDFPGANVRWHCSSIIFTPKFENRFEKLVEESINGPSMLQLDEVKKLREIGKLKGYTSEVNKMLLIAGLEAEEKIKPSPF